MPKPTFKNLVKHLHDEDPNLDQLEVARLRAIQGDKLGKYLNEKLTNSQFSWSYTAEGGFGIRLAHVPDEFFEQVIRPELRRMADGWGYEMSSYMQGSANIQVNFTKDWKGL